MALCRYSDRLLRPVRRSVRKQPGFVAGRTLAPARVGVVDGGVRQDHQILTKADLTLIVNDWVLSGTAKTVGVCHIRSLPVSAIAHRRCRDRVAW